MGAVVLDSSLVIGFLHPDDTWHERASGALVEARELGERLVMPASVLAESLVSAYRASLAEGRALEADLVALFGPVRAVDTAVARTTARLRATHRSLRFPDALVIATGIVEDAVVVTCDRRLAGVDDRVQVVSAA